MKVDGLGVIMAIILLPIILVITYYIQLQVDTIARENAYNTKLLDATYDAMSAFEINTANEELSSVADSMRSIILASNNTFFNTLAANLGMSNASKENLRPYVPAILYTMYDGYYIYSPAETAVVGEKTEEKDGLITTKGYLSVGGIGVTAEGSRKYSYDSKKTTITDKPYDESDPTSVYGAILYKDKNNEGEYTTDKNNAVTETDYILKPYTQYSARYVNGNIDVTINYTLDNYINIEGTIDGVYYTKSGYLINKDLVKNYNGVSDFSSLSADDIKNEILGVESIAEGNVIHAKEHISLTVNNSVIEANWANISSDDSIKTISEAEEMQKKGQLSKQQIYEIQKYKAIAYYVSSAVFSNWVYSNLGVLEYKDIQNQNNMLSGSKLGSDLNDFYYSFEGNTTKIFDSSQDPEATESNFNTHRIEVIKNSIKYNLNQSISAYAKMKGDKNKYSMPVLTDSEWDNILSKISIVSFMQGLDCGLDVYNNYEIAYSSNNELTVIPSEIYYVPVDSFNDGQSDYHRIDCPSLADSSNGYIAFKSNEIKYDKLLGSDGKYKYDHKNLGCYICINNNNYASEFSDSNLESYYGRINTLGNTNKKLAGYIGLGAMRQGTYKTNALTVSEGYEVDNSKNKQYKYGVEYESININDNKIKKIELTFKNAGYTEGRPLGYVTISVNEASYNIGMNVTQTITIEKAGNINIGVESENGYVNLESIKYIYK